ncbi:hypothetical protein [uncultured Piscinibacter sp.]|uniref:hypothetical protein n=1 Tax=uncultured Piscinibacter sp. TaxID=1131835 RepID=UPI00260AE93F|nr:hypothetical protein [uncultured Piscinibacter sp.]
MSTYQPLRRTHRAVFLTLALLVNAGLAGFIDGLAGAASTSAAVAAAQPAATGRA